MAAIASSSSAEWDQRFIAALRRHPEAEKSLEILESEGVEREFLLDVLREYANPDAARRERIMRVGASKTAMQAEKVEKQMRQLAERLAAQLEDISTIFPSGWQTINEADAVEKLRAAIESIAGLRQHYLRKSSLKGKARDERTLVYLCLMIQHASKSPRWSDLAYLLEAAFKTYGRDEDWNADRVRKLVERFQRSHSELYNGWNQFFSQRQASVRNGPTPIKRSRKNRRGKKDKEYVPLSYRDLSPKGGRK